MTPEEFDQQLEALSKGELVLEAPEGNGVTPYANEWLQDLKRYVRALERGYRARGEAMEIYRTKMGKHTLQELLDSQWSDGACKGYLIMALRQAGANRVDIDAGLECLEDCLEIFSMATAAEEAQRYLEGRALPGTHAGRELAEAVGRLWRQAAPGYALEALRKAGVDPETATAVLDAMEELMDGEALEAAATARASVLEAGAAPEWIGPSAELLGGAP